MHLSCSRRIELTSPVVKSECHVRRLLDLSDEETSVCSMYCARSYIHNVSLLRIDDIEDLFHRAVLAPVIEFLGSDVTSESAIHLRTWLGVHDVPDFSLSQRIISFCSDLIVRMHLHGKLVVDVKKLDKQRELASIKVIHILSHDPLKIGLHDLAYCVSCQPSVLHHRILNAHVGKFPAFTDQSILSKNRLITFAVHFNEMLAEFSDKCASTPRSP